MKEQQQQRLEWSSSSKLEWRRNNNKGLNEVAAINSNEEAIIAKAWMK